ncbi:hypothetical protein [Tritonibacter mobilis]|uniref:hypothetical protein n=1 Tax=Tritonibacter mobilis TaxID=379347 RepID=UPI000B571CB8|nr:hypothetical protein [Tritonibacter mobilis]ANH49097.1 hypothetical protein [Ruegeria phage 45A6]
MGKKDDLIAKATELGIELDSTETIADLEAKIAAHEATADGEGESDVQPEAADAGATSEPDEQAEDEGDAEGGTADTATVPVGSSAWALAALASGERVMREIWTDNHHLDPAHIRAGIRLTFEDVFANDWKVV